MTRFRNQTMNTGIRGALPHNGMAAQLAAEQRCIRHRINARPGKSCSAIFGVCGAELHRKPPTLNGGSRPFLALVVRSCTGNGLPGMAESGYFGGPGADRNGDYQVSYDEFEEISRSRVGDRVRICLLALPYPCPPNDHRGYRCTSTNLKTGESWTLPDSPHMCGGA